MANEQVRPGGNPSTSRNANAQGRSMGGADTSAAATAQARRLSGPLDESGSPVSTPTPSAASPTAPGGSPAKLGNSAVSRERTLDDEIRLRAYERFLSRQGQPGDPHDDWCCAEREVKEKLWPKKKETSEPGI